MKQVLFTLLLLPFLANADVVYDAFLALKESGRAERIAFYHNISNNMANMRFQWRGDEWGGTFSATNICSGITNIEYDVDLVNVTTNVVSTNLTSVVKRFSNGEVHHFTYLAEGRISRIEHWLARRGDFKCYDFDGNEELSRYCSMTNFIGEHGVMVYRGGRLVEVGGIPDFSIFR